MIGLLYIRLDYDETAPQNMNSLLFLIIVNTSFGNIFAVTQVRNNSRQRIVCTQMNFY